MLMTATYTAPAPVSQMLLSLSNTVSQCVDSISNRMCSNHLQLYADKTEVMWCSSTSKLSQLSSCSLSVAGALVSPDNAVRDLGVFIDNDLGAAPHVWRTVLCCFAALRQLCHLRQYVTDDCFRSLVVSLVKTRLRQLCPGQASSILAAAPPVCSQRCGSSDIAYKTLRSCLRRHCNSTLASSTTMSQHLRGRHGISCAAWFHSTMPE